MRISQFSQTGLLLCLFYFWHNRIAYPCSYMLLINFENKNFLTEKKRGKTSFNTCSYFPQIPFLRNEWRACFFPLCKCCWTSKHDFTILKLCSICWGSVIFEDTASILCLWNKCWNPCCFQQHKIQFESVPVDLLWRRSRKANSVEYILLFNDKIAKETLKVQILNYFWTWAFFFLRLEKALKKLTYMFKIQLHKFDSLQLQIIWTLRKFLFYILFYLLLQPRP